MELLSVNWTSVWQMTGVGIGVVFCILILLVFILQGFSAVASKLNAQPKVDVQKPKPMPKPTAVTAEAGNDEAAIATALYLFFQDVHDEESFCLTIHHDSHPAWHSEFTSYKN